MLAQACRVRHCNHLTYETSLCLLTKYLEPPLTFLTATDRRNLFELWAPRGAPHGELPWGNITLGGCRSSSRTGPTLKRFYAGGSSEVFVGEPLCCDLSTLLMLLRIASRHERRLTIPLHCRMMMYFINKSA